MTRRVYKQDDEKRVELREALDMLKAAGARKTAAKVRSAISSCKGAQRNIGMLQRSQDQRATANQGPLCTCDNCSYICHEAELNEPKDLDQRLDFPIGHPDCIEPAGECPKCGALSYDRTKRWPVKVPA